MNNEFYSILDYYVPNPKCELNYDKDYELLIATVLSAQCTDKMVNRVTSVLFERYDLNGLMNASFDEIANIIKPCGSFNKKSVYIKNIVTSLIEDFGGIVPNNRLYLESLPGVGRKTTNVVLKNLYGVPCIPVDTHVMRVTKRLGIAASTDSPDEIEVKLRSIIPIDKWNKVGEQILLFGRYYCTSLTPKCENCKFKNFCKEKR